MERKFNFISTFRLYSALYDVGKGSSVRKAALKWNVGRTTLLRLKKDPLHPLSRPLKILSENDEEILEEWVLK